MYRLITIFASLLFVTNACTQNAAVNQEFNEISKITELVTPSAYKLLINYMRPKTCGHFWNSTLRLLQDTAEGHLNLLPKWSGGHNPICALLPLHHCW